MTTTASWFRHADPRFPFLWESAPQPPARWHAGADAPATYLADTPDGAWAEFLRHEQIVDAADLPGISRRMWALELADPVVREAAAPELPPGLLRGGLHTSGDCQAEARRLRAAGASALRAPSAALRPGTAGGQVVRAGLHEAERRDGVVLVLFGGDWPQVRGWVAVSAGAPDERVLALVNALT